MYSENYQIVLKLWHRDMNCCTNSDSRNFTTGFLSNFYNCGTYIIAALYNCGTYIIAALYTLYISYTFSLSYQLLSLIRSYRIRHNLLKKLNNPVHPNINSANNLNSLYQLDQCIWSERLMHLEGCGFDSQWDSYVFDFRVWEQIVPRFSSTSYNLLNVML